MAIKKASTKAKALAENRQLTFLAAAKSSANALHLFLNGEEMDLTRDGDDWSGKEKRPIADTLAVNFTVNGFEGTDWSLTVSIDCPQDPAKLISKSGTVGDPGGHGFAQTVKIPADPCGGGLSPRKQRAK